MKLVVFVVRLILGATLAAWVGPALLAPEVPRPAALAAAGIFLATLWRPGAGLLLAAVLAPAAALLAPPPARAAELLAWALLAAWLLRVWRPLAPRGPAAGAGPRAVTTPAGLYAAALVASWLMLTIAGAAGVPAAALPVFVFQSIPDDHLVFSSPEPETWTALQSLTGMALLFASLATSRGDPRLRRAVAWTLVGSLTVLAGATLVDIARQWAEAEYGAWFLLRYVRGERASLHLGDLNAAGSLYVLAGLTAVALALLDARRRAAWLLPLLPIVPALWLTGSRSSFLAVIAGLLILAVAQRRWPLTRRQVTVTVTVVGLMLLVAAAGMDWQPDVRGSAGRAANLRTQFLETTARMFASAPLYGVGIGRYFDRSAEFMPAALRELYGNENAHNYFAQQFAELGVVGGLLFLWLVAALVAAGWIAARERPGDTTPAVVGLFAGTSAYFLTCLTGHPLLVSEAALPFWIACGALAGAVDETQRLRYRRGALVAVVCALLAVGVARAALSYGRVTDPPLERGFHGLETAPDGTAFRWMTRHAVTYVPSGAGFVRLRVRAPEVALRRPLAIEISIAGEVVDRREIPAGRWLTYDVPVRRPTSAPFRRVDLRANQVWTQETRLGKRRAERPVTVMVGGVQWIPLEQVGR